MKNEKVKIKPLVKPVKIIIDIRVYTYWDKTYGNPYCSARCTVNNDYDNEIIYPFQYNSVSQCGREVLNLAVEKFRSLDKLTNLYYTSQALEQGVLIMTTVTEAKQADCKRFGRA